MGAFDVVAPITIPNPDDPVAAELFRTRWKWEPHEQVVLKGDIDVSDQEYVTNKYGKSKKGGDLEYAMGAGRFAILDRVILAWTFTQNGNAIPVTPANIRRLPARYSNAILEVVDEITKTMTVEEQEDFLVSANGHTVESSGSTKLSLKKS